MSSLEAKHCRIIEEIDVSRDRISSLPNDLLIQILFFMSTKDAVSTTILSKRWRFIWTMVPKLEFKDTKNFGKFLELHKAPVLESLCIRQKETGIDVKELVSYSVDRFVRKIELELLWTAELTTLPKSFYTCKTLVKLTLSNKIIVDVPSSAYLPSLKVLHLILVLFKDENSLKNLVSGCSVLARSRMVFSINSWRNHVPGKNIIRITSNVPTILVVCNTDDKCHRVFSLVTSLHLVLTDPMVLHFNGIVFSRLQVFALCLSGHLWMDLLRMMLTNSPKLKILDIRPVSTNSEIISFPWIQPNVVPSCLSSHLQELRWKGYRGNEQEKQVMRYILANSKCLKKVTIILTSSTLDPEEKEMIIKEMQSMSRVSTSELLIIDPYKI